MKLSQLEQRLCQKIQANERELIALLRDLVAIDTSDPPAENYDKCSDYLVTYLSDFLNDISILDLYNDSKSYNANKKMPRPNVLGILPGTNNRPTLHFNGHYDVVQATGNWNNGPYNPVIKDGRLYGRGSADMKAGIAAFLIALKTLVKESIPLKGALSFSFVPDEENDGPAGTKFLIEQNKVSADYCIVMEPSGGYGIYNGHKGNLLLELTVFGKAAHASSPWEGINAFDKMIDILTELKAKLKSKYKTDQYYILDPTQIREAGTISIGGRVSTGESPNVVPSKCSVTLDRRLAPGETITEALNDINSTLVAAKKKDPKLQANINILSEYEPCAISIDSPLVNVLTSSIESITNKQPSISLMKAGCDMRYFNYAGIPTVIYGPGDLSIAHQVNEYVDLSQVLLAAQVYAVTAIRLLEIQ